jgi:hypothetical protein
MGGKTNQSTQQQSVPADVLARYNSVNNQAQQTAATPFQTYSTDPNAFVAPLTDSQQSGIAGTTAAAGTAQPYYSAATSQLLNAQGATQPYYSAAGQDITSAQSNANPLQAQAASGYTSALGGAQPYQQGATGLALAGAQAVNPTDLSGADIGKYLSPYLSTVLGSTAGLLNQNNQQQQAGQLGNAITSGAFGGDRAGIAAANLEQQQNLSNANIYSGIANQGYTNALATAQQQQGLGLSAAQANRAALANASGQIQSIGQQGYEQGTGTAAQQAALGQQEFGQGITASQAQSGLGSLVYNTGANTAQTLAGLGAGAQTAGLQGAQAELAAGTTQQQTEQAGKTALYNQFLQQQSYPFQVSQYLANIAEGTGALSGSTTTTTQPGSLFSDKRLKEHIRAIGETHDGQKIYSYRYKGDDTTHIGLLAQDVEKKHPEAVGLAGGFKTVDYDKATEDSAKRGHFYSGGLVPANDDGYAEGGPVGFDPQLMEQILSNSQGMYGPYTAGLAGGAASPSSGPYGGSGRVPTANVPVGQLKGASELQKPTSGLQQASNVADFASNAAKGYDWLKDKIPQTANDAPGDVTSTPVEDTLPPFRRGGLVKRYASGGTPYDAGLGLDIPDDQPTAKLPSAPALSGGSGNSTISDLADAAKLAATVAKFIPMNAGGTARKGYDAGGSPDLQDYNPSQVSGNDPWSLGNIISTIGKKMNVSKNDPTTDALDAKSGSGGGDWQGSAGNMADFPAGKKPTDVPSAGLGAAHRGHPKDSWSAGPPTDFGSSAPDTAAPQPAQINPDIAAPAPATNPGLSTAAPDLSAVTPNPQSPLAGLGNGASDVVHSIASKVAPKGGYLDRLFHGDEQTLVPFLAGLGAMTAAPTRNFGTALAQGLSAGAMTYPKLQTQQQELAKAKAATELEQAGVAQRKAQTGQIGAQTTKTQQENAVNFYKLQQAGLLRPDPNGLIIDPATGTKYSNTQAGAPISGAPGDASAPTYKYLGKSVQDVLPKSAHQFVMDSPEMGINPNPGNIATSNKIIADTYQTSQDAKTAKNIQNEQAAALLSQSRSGVLSQGALAPVFQPYVEKFNSLVTDNGHPEWAIQGLGDAQIAHKLQLGQAAAQSTGAGQHAYQALSDFTSLAPGTSLDPKAAATLMAQNAVSATRAIDQQNVLAEAKSHAPNGNYEAQDILAAFNQDNPPTVYNAMRDAVAGIYQAPAYHKIHAALSKPGSSDYADQVKVLDAFGAKHGIPNFSRVFTGE